MSAIEARLREMVAATADADPREVHDGANLATDLALDALDLLTVAMTVELEFGIKISDEAIGGWTYFGDLVAFVERAAAR